MIVYILAIASPTHPVASLYHMDGQVEITSMENHSMDIPSQ